MKNPEIKTNKSGMSQTKSGMSHTKSGMLHTKSGMSHTKSGMSQTKSGISQTKSGNPESKSGLSQTKSGMSQTKSGMSQTKSETSQSKSGISSKTKPVKSEDKPVMSETKPGQSTENTIGRDSQNTESNNLENNQNTSPQPKPKFVKEEWMGKCIIHRLDVNVETEDLYNLFEPFGELEYASLVRKDDFQIGFVMFCNLFDADRALEILNGINFGDTKLKIDRTSGSGFPNDYRNAQRRKNDMAKYVKNVDDEDVVSSPFLLATNMFDVSEPKQPGWDIKICHEILEIAERFEASILHIFVDQISPQGSVYMKCPNEKDAETMVRALHGLTYNGRQIQMDCIPSAIYYHLLPEAETAQQPIELANVTSTPSSSVPPTFRMPYPPTQSRTQFLNPRMDTLPPPSTVSSLR